VFTVPESFVQKYNNTDQFNKVETQQQKQESEQAKPDLEATVEKEQTQKLETQPILKDKVYSMYDNGASVNNIVQQLNSSTQDINSMLVNYMYNLQAENNYVKTVKQISTELNISSVYKHLDKNTVRRRDQISQKIQNRAKIVSSDYNTGLKVVDIAEKYNVSKSTVYRDLKRVY